MGGRGEERRGNTDFEMMYWYAMVRLGSVLDVEERGQGAGRQ